VPGYVTSNKRSTFSAVIHVPGSAKKPVAVLSENRRDFQNNTLNAESRQYWAEVNETSGEFTIPRVVSGIYRLTVYAEGVFGWFIQDDVVVSDSTGGKNYSYKWTEEKAGTEVWRIGIPDKSAGEFKHGKKPYANKTLEPEEYRQYWAVWDFPTDFPNGVNYKVGESNYAEDFNYIHWSVISNVGNFFRNESYHENVNNWTIVFDLDNHQIHNTKTATLTVAVAGAKTGSGTDWVNLPYTLNVNGEDVETFIVPWFRSTSCGVRGAVSCNNFDHKFVFPTEKLKNGENSFILSLPADAASVETAVLPWTTYLQYDALRLEIE
jgi:rhamnogalacturonan endolyase